MRKGISIRRALFTNVAMLTLIPMAVVVLISLFVFHGEIVRRIRMDNEKVANTVSAALELFLPRAVVLLEQIKYEVDQECTDSPTCISRSANDLISTDPVFESVHFVSADGNIVAVAGDRDDVLLHNKIKQDFSSAELFKKVKNSGKVAWTEPFVSLRSGESVISAGIPWRNGMIYGTMNLLCLNKLLEPTRHSRNAYVFIVSSEGRLIAHPDSALVGEKEAFVSIPQITAGLQGRSGTYLFNISGRNVIGSVLPFRQNDWVIVAAHDKESAYASLYRMELLLAGVALLMLIAAFFYAFRRVTRITEPVQVLSATADRIAAGEPEGDRGDVSTYKEVFELYENFSRMAEAVASREKELQVQNAALQKTELELKSQVEEYIKTYDALVSEKVKLESILASMGEGLSIQNLEYKVVLQNNAHRALIGDAVGKYCYQAYRHSDIVCPECPMKQAFEDGDTHVTLRKVELNGVNVCFEISVSPLRNAQNEVVGGIEVVRDVTEREVSNAEIRRLNQELEVRVIERTAELEAANRELEAFSYSVSHDLRSPLRHIAGFSSILEEEHAAMLDKEGQRCLSRIIAGCSKMGELIDDLLELSQVSRGDLHAGRVNLSNLAEAIAASLQDSQPDRDVTFTIEAGLETNGDERLLEIMLNNLIGNAWKYSSKTEGASIIFGSERIAARSVFYVRDNGAGFDKSFADNLFLPFHRLHGGEFEGTGIGLAIVQRIVNRHGGKIWADAAPDEGATFFFTLGGARS